MPTANSARLVETNPLDAAKASVQEEIKGLEAKSVTLDRDIVSKEESKQKAIADAETSGNSLRSSSMPATCRLRFYLYRI